LTDAEAQVSCITDVNPLLTIRAGGTLVTVGRAIFVVVEPDRLQLADLAERVRSGRLKPIIGAVRPLAGAPSAFIPGHRIPGKTITRVTDDDNRTRASDRPADRSRATCPDRKARGGRPTGCTGPPGDAATSTARQTHQR
jgi:hypothetical protein